MLSMWSVSTTHQRIIHGLLQVLLSGLEGDWVMESLQRVSAGTPRLLAHLLLLELLQYCTDYAGQGTLSKPRPGRTSK
jgi:hypothetical protein